MAERHVTEEWRHVPGYEGIYEASNLGRVRSLDRTGIDGRRLRGRVLAQNLRGAYMAVALHRSGTQRTVDVHRVVLESFAGEGRPGMEARHLNGDPRDNRAENLRWGTASENNLDRVRHQTHPGTSKVECPLGHPLADGNLVASELRAGRRSCLSCNRARSYARKRGVDFTRELADSYLAIR